jgi:hypothetical protein
MSCPLRIRAVPLMPKLAAKAWSSGSTMADSPPPPARRRDRVAGVPLAEGSTAEDSADVAVGVVTGAA